EARSGSEARGSQAGGEACRQARREKGEGESEEARRQKSQEAGEEGQEAGQAQGGEETRPALSRRPFCADARRRSPTLLRARRRTSWGSARRFPSSFRPLTSDNCLP